MYLQNILDRVHQKQHNIATESLHQSYEKDHFIDCLSAQSKAMPRFVFAAETETTVRW